MVLKDIKVVAITAASAVQMTITIDRKRDLSSFLAYSSLGLG
jgi:hypothetical protein